MGAGDGSGTNHRAVSSIPPGISAACTPDNKDLTWILERSCPECGYDTGTITGADPPALVGCVAAEWRGLLQAGGTVAVRPRPDKWSTLEYGCHVCDVFGWPGSAWAWCSPRTTVPSSPTATRTRRRSATATAAGIPLPWPGS
jgi:hypothetical protein